VETSTSDKRRSFPAFYGFGAGRWEKPKPWIFWMNETLRKLRPASDLAADEAPRFMLALLAGNLRITKKETRQDAKDI
jgi:hypothetical protein